jgi:hypothetical protein
MFLNQPAGALSTTCFFVCGHDHDDFPCGGTARSGELSDRDCVHDGDALHVEGTAAPDEAFGHLASERVAGPTLFFNGHDIAVGQQNKCRTVVGSVEAGDQARATLR